MRIERPRDEIPVVFHNLFERPRDEIPVVFHNFFEMPRDVDPGHPLMREIN